MACASCQQRRQAIARAAAAVKHADVLTVKREAGKVAKSALADLMRLARRREERK